MAPPRSGSNFLFEALSRIPRFFHTWHESDRIWWTVFPYARMPEMSDRVDGAEATPNRVAELRRRLFGPALETYARKLVRRRIPFSLAYLAQLRFLDKTIANCFHLDFIERAFPDADYVLLVREPRANIASMIEGWAHPERFGKHALKQELRRYPPATVQEWNYPAPPGWQAQVARPLEEICAWSWQQHVERIAAFADAHRERTTLVRYEVLSRDVRAVVATILEQIDMPYDERWLAGLDQSRLSRTTVSAPDADKWRRQEDHLQRVLPLVRSAAKRIGYEV